MPELTPRLLSHFSMLRFLPEYYRLPTASRQAFAKEFIAKMNDSSETSWMYQVFPAQAHVDLLVWNSIEVKEQGDAANFFERLACALLPFRMLVEPKQTLWGFTRPSQYTKTRSNQELDPLTPHRKPYLVIYPFTKTADWYLLSQESRQGMMNGHIKLGKQFPEISQMLLYSFGLQDQEFVVVYEMNDLTQFSDLVYVLRDTDARRYTLSDTPLYAGLYHPAEETLSLWEQRYE